VKGGWKKVMFMLVLRKVAAVVVWSVSDEDLDLVLCGVELVAFDF
jgi:hypothetical protein